MGKKDKKKGKGAEKTAMKTEKKALNKLKKSLAAKGENEIENLIVECQQKSKRDFCEEVCSQPSPRSGFSFCAHPDKDEIIMYGGEYYNGSQTTMYDELYFYNIKKDKWTIIHSPEKPSPRSSHQAVTVPHLGGQMWIFGGEFVSPSRSNFYHYKDLWVFLFSEKKWHEVKAPGGPTARSGHRMVACQKQLIVFGGFQESVSDYKYFNDIYLFNLETYHWSKIEASGKIPSPRSACQMASLSDGRILVYGGYCREKIKKDVDKGIALTDMFILHLDERTSPPKWKWIQVKVSGMPPSARSGLSIAVGLNNRAYLFGGVQDEDPDEENLNSIFYNDLYLLELELGRWHPIALEGNRRKQRRKNNIPGKLDEEEIMETLESTNIPEPPAKSYEDEVFSVRIGPQASESVACSFINPKPSPTLPLPKSRMNAGLIFKHGILYLYGGLLEDEDQQYTLSDFHKLDTNKLDEWQTIVPYSSDGMVWIESEESSEESEDSDSSFEEMDTM